MKTIKIVAGVVAGLLLLVIVAALVVASFFDPNDYKGYATNAFQARTGRTLAIGEELRFSYFPWLAVETGGIAIGNAAGFGDEPFATIERAAARVKLLPLLSRQLEIGTVVLDGLTLNLARDAQRNSNWQDFLDAADRAEPAAPGEAGAASARSFDFEGLRIDDGSVTFRENTTELRYAVTDLSLETGSIGLGTPVDFDLNLNFRSEPDALDVALSASATAQIAAHGPIGLRDLSAEATLTNPANSKPVAIDARLTRLDFDADAQSLIVAGLTAEAEGVRAALEIRGSTLSDHAAFEGTLTTEPAPIASLLALAGVDPPAGVDPQTLGEADVAASFRFRSTPRELTLSNVVAHTLGMNVTGDATIDADDTFKGRVAVAEFAPTEEFLALVRPAASADVDLSAIGELALATSFEVNLPSGRASFADVEANALGAAITGSLEIVPGDGRSSVYRGAIATSLFSPEAAAKVFGDALSGKLALHELGAVALDARFVYDRQADTITVAPFKADAFGLKASGEMLARHWSRDPIWSGHAQVAEFSPQALITRFGLPPQPTSDPKALTRATVDARFTVDKDAAKLEDLVLALDDSRITGDFTIAGFETPKYLFTLAVDRVDADRYLPPKARDAEAGEATAGDIELPENNTMEMDGQMQIGSLTLAGLSFADVGSRIVLGGGNAKLAGARARLYGGEFNGNFEVKAAGVEPGLALDGRASGLQLQPLIEALTAEPANVSGTGSFDLNLAGRGRTVIENVQTAGGSVSFSMVDGAIKGFNLGRTLCAAFNVTQRAPAPPEQPAVTAYEGIKGTAEVTGGVARSSDLLARTSFMDINGAGTLALASQELDYELDAKLTGPIGIPNCETLDPYVGNALPFEIEGTVTAPRITPDFSKLAQRVLREEVQERLEDRLKDRLRDLLR